MLDGSGVDEHVFIRGSPRRRREPAPRRLLEALAGPEPLPVGARQRPAGAGPADDRPGRQPVPARA